MSLLQVAITIGISIYHSLATNYHMHTGDLLMMYYQRIYHMC